MAASQDHNAALPNFGGVSNVNNGVLPAADEDKEHQEAIEDQESPMSIEHGDPLTRRTTIEEAESQVYSPLAHDGNNRELLELARAFSRQQSRPGRSKSFRSEKHSLQRTFTELDFGADDPRLDPASPQFDLTTYLRMIMKMMSQESIGVKEAGFIIKNLNVYGSGQALNFQETVSGMLTFPLKAKNLFTKTPHKQILYSHNATLRQGELLVVLGRPGSGCSTFLKTVCGEQHGLILDDKTEIHYAGIKQSRMIKEFKGEVLYNQEVDKHFPHLTVGETLEHAAACRLPARQPLPIKRKEVIKHITQVVMSVFGLSHTYNTKVGNDFVRGVSGGERKRVSIAEMAIAATPIAAWDNSTRGLDSQSAYNFVKSLRLTADIANTTHAVAIYQASQAIYDLFDRAAVLYEGRQIYYGNASQAKAYFEDMGWECPARQTTGDFLTSVTNPVERQARSGFENKVPRTPEDFEKHWKQSPQYATLIKDIEQYEQEYPVGNSEQLEKMRELKKDAQSKYSNHKSPYVASTGTQLTANTKRAWQRVWNDKSSTIAQTSINIVFALIIGSVFYNTPDATAGFQSKGAVLFFAILLNALSAISEISGLYAQRPIVEKHKSYAFYHPWTEAMAGLILDIPIKFLVAVCFNIILYFLAGLRREPGAFFLYFLITFITTFVMSAVFRTMAALTKTVSQAMALSGVLVLAIVVYTGFTLPVPYMHPWFSWIRFINPIFYAFEILIANEFHGRDFTCSQIIPAYSPPIGTSWICGSVGAVAGQDFVNGDAYIATAYEYTYAHVWRNFGILCAFLVGFLVMYMTAVELNSSTSSTAEVLVFRKGNAPAYLEQAAKGKDDETSTEGESVSKTSSSEDQKIDAIPPQTDIFTWQDVVYTVKLKTGDHRRLLDNVSGWVKPGTLTALMGSSGAGKTTLLDALAQRLSVGVISGDMLVNGNPLRPDFQRQTGYVQQQDLHLETSTVREALRFSAVLRQARTETREAKYEYVEQVIQMLGMQDFAEAVVGVPGQGLNVEQRKLLTIGVELAAKPKLLLFLDEPTSGLDSQSSWAICSFLRKLADHGQAVLCTIHQPSAILFEQFDRLLFLQKGGQTVYFGDVGKNSRTLLDYFEHNGGRHCGQDENPAEYMLELVNNGEKNWHDVWKSSGESSQMLKDLEQLKNSNKSSQSEGDSKLEHSEFAMPLTAQIYEVTYRVFQQYWRMPAYVMAKYALAIASSLFIGFSFYGASTSLQGMQIVLYSLFMIVSIFSTIVQQIQPMFISQRDLYEVRERLSKAYSWVAFLFAQIVVEIPYQILMGIVTYACFYYAVVGIQDSERQGLVLLFCIELFVYASTFAHMTIAAMPDAQTAGAIVTLLFAMSLVFCGVMQAPSALPGFWIFMYRVSPFTYWVGGMANAMLGQRAIVCSETEVSKFDPPANLSCQQYLGPYISAAGGTLQNPTATSGCEYCQLSNADQFLSSVQIYWNDRWRDFGLVWVYIFFNIFAVIAIYWFFRVRPVEAAKKKSKKEQKA